MDDPTPVQRKRAQHPLEPVRSKNEGLRLTPNHQTGVHSSALLARLSTGLPYRPGSARVSLYGGTFRAGVSKGDELQGVITVTSPSFERGFGCDR